MGCCCGCPDSYPDSFSDNFNSGIRKSEWIDYLAPTLNFNGTTLEMTSSSSAMPGIYVLLSPAGANFDGFDLEVDFTVFPKPFGSSQIQCFVSPITSGIGNSSLAVTGWGLWGSSFPIVDDYRLTAGGGTSFWSTGVTDGDTVKIEGRRTGSSYSEFDIDLKVNGTTRISRNSQTIDRNFSGDPVEQLDWCGTAFGIRGYGGTLEFDNFDASFTY